MSRAPAHSWKFVRRGGLDQVSLETGADLLALDRLDPKLWVALSCPVRGLELDERTLALIDTDGDGHIRVPDVVAAVRWAAARLKDAGLLLKGSPELALASIEEASPEGRALREAAGRAAARLGKADAAFLTVEDLDPARVFAAGPTGEGIVPPDLAPDPETRALIDDLAACAGTQTGRSGRPGVTAAQAAAFFKEITALATALDAPPSPPPAGTPAPPEPPAARLGPTRIREIAAGHGRAGLQALFARDEAAAPEFRATAEVERLARYHRDLRTLLRNFVNFFDFYSRGEWAAFQAGTLFMDGRSCELCIRVDDPAAHAVLGAMSELYIAYVDCRRPDGQAMKVAACFTQGDRDYLFVGRNGVLWDRRGRDWDATVVKIVENPISLREAFFSPYKKFLRMIETQFLQRAAAADAAAAKGELPLPKAKIDVGTVAALGVAVGGLSAAFGYVVSALAGHHSLILVILAGVVIAISGPSVFIAWFKLGKRNLGPLLEANGWAVNGRVKINRPLGAALTDRARLPEGARRQLDDPYSDRAAALRRWLLALLVLALAGGLAFARLRGAWPFAPVSGAPSNPATSTAPSGR